MAKLSGLIPVVARVLDVPEKTVAIYARHLRQARLITTSGRGPGGAEMTARDCANLLIAIMGGNYAKDAAETVARYRSIVTGVPWQKWQLPQLPLPALKELSKHHGFGEALDALIVSAKDGSLEVALDAASRKFIEARLSISPRLEVTVYGPLPVARISIRASEWEEDLTYILPNPWMKADNPPETEVAKWTEEVDKEGPRGDLEQSRRISARTILALGHFLKESPSKSLKDDDSEST